MTPPTAMTFQSVLADRSRRMWRRSGPSAVALQRRAGLRLLDRFLVAHGITTRRCDYGRPHRYVSASRPRADPESYNHLSVLSRLFEWLVPRDHCRIAAARGAARARPSPFLFTAAPIPPAAGTRAAPCRSAGAPLRGFTYRTSSQCSTGSGCASARWRASSMATWISIVSPVDSRHQVRQESAAAVRAAAAALLRYLTPSSSTGRPPPSSRSSPSARRQRINAIRFAARSTHLLPQLPLTVPAEHPPAAGPRFAAFVRREHFAALVSDRHRSGRPAPTPVHLPRPQQSQRDGGLSHDHRRAVPGRQ